MKDSKVLLHGSFTFQRSPAQSAFAFPLALMNLIGMPARFIRGLEELVTVNALVLLWPLVHQVLMLSSITFSLERLVTERALVRPVRSMHGRDVIIQMILLKERLPTLLTHLIAWAFPPVVDHDFVVLDSARLAEMAPTDIAFERLEFRMDAFLMPEELPGRSAAFVAFWALVKLALAVEDA